MVFCRISEQKNGRFATKIAHYLKNYYDRRYFIKYINKKITICEKLLTFINTNLTLKQNTLHIFVPEFKKLLNVH